MINAFGRDDLETVLFLVVIYFLNISRYTQRNFACFGVLLVLLRDHVMRGVSILQGKT